MNLKLSLLLFILASLPTRAAAYRTGGDTAELSDTERVRLAPTIVGASVVDEPPPGIELGAYASATRDAFAAWSEPACSALDVRWLGVTEQAARSDDARITVESIQGAWASRGFSADVAATTDLLYVRGEDGEWRIADADVLINAEDYTWSLDGAERGDLHRDLSGVLSHEVGHCIGLLHPCEPTASGDVPMCEPASAESATMYPIHFGVEQRSLAGDDVEGVCFLYPTSECSEACSAAAVCVDGQCEPLCGTQTCASDEQCIDDRCVDCAIASCAEPEPECAIDAECAPGYRCRSGLCHDARSSLGDPCMSDVECLSSACGAGRCTSPCDDSRACPAGATCGDGSCVSLAAGLGDACEIADDCSSGLCLANLADEPFCTRSCSARACPNGYVCAEVDGVDVCRSPPPSGCGVVSGVPGGAAPWLLTFALALLRRRRDPP